VSDATAARKGVKKQRKTIHVHCVVPALHTYLQHAHGDGERPVRGPLAHDAKQLRHRARRHAGVVRRPLDRERLAGPRLAVREDAHVVAVEDGHHQRLHGVEDGFLCAVGGEDAVVLHCIAIHCTREEGEEAWWMSDIK